MEDLYAGTRLKEAERFNQSNDASSVFVTNIPAEMFRLVQTMDSRKLYFS